MGKARAGRKRKVNVMRHPSGQPVRRTHVEREREIKANVVSYRMSQFGLSEANAEQPAAETAIGRAYQISAISDAQYNAAKAYWAAARRYRKALLIKPLASAGDLQRAGGYDGGEGDEPEYVEDCDQVRRAFGDMRRALLDADRFAYFAVEAWVIEDKVLWNMIGELRIGLNALARLRGIGAGSE